MAVNSVRHPERNRQSGSDREIVRKLLVKLSTGVRGLTLGVTVMQVQL